MTIFYKLSEYRTPLMGVAMICVFIFHSMGDWMPTFIHNIAKKGDVGVDIFLFLSAIGLTFSLTKNPDILDFYKRRALRILPTYWLIMSCVYLFVFVMTSVHLMPDNYYPIPRNLCEIVQAYTTIGYWVTGGIFYLWYIPAILLLYLVFPFVHKLFESYRWTYILALVPGAVITFFPPNIEWYHNCLLYRAGIFLWGGIFSMEFLQKNRNVNVWSMYLMGIMSFLFYVIRSEINLGAFNRIAEEILFFVALPCILVCVTWVCRIKWIASFTGFVGKVSLEFYLIHEFTMRFMETISNVVITLPPSVQKIVTFIVSLFLAYLVHCIMQQFIISPLKNKKVTI